MAKLLTDAQEKHLTNIRALIEGANVYHKNIKLANTLDSLKEEYNLNDDELKQIEDILNKEKFYLDKNSADAILLRGFLMKLEEFGLRFPYKIKDEVMFDFEDNFNLDYVYSFADKKLKTNASAKINSKMKEMHEAGKTVSEIAKAVKLEEKKVEKYITSLERTINMRKNNPKVK